MPSLHHINGHSSEGPTQAAAVSHRSASSDKQSAFSPPPDPPPVDDNADVMNNNGPLPTPSNCFPSDDGNNSGIIPSVQHHSTEQENNDDTHLGKHVEETADNNNANDDGLSQSEHKQDDVNYPSPSQVASQQLLLDADELRNDDEHEQNDERDVNYPSPSQVASQQLLLDEDELDAEELRIDDNVVLPEYNNNHAASAVMNGSSRNITRVDGKGLWRSWKRNFNSQVSH